jgi:GAF domain-containing protein/CheY-like chemotaxis protein
MVSDETMMNPSEREQTVHRMITRRVVPGIILAFGLIGVLAMLGLQTDAYNNLRDAHRLIVGGIVHALKEDLEHFAGDLETLASEQVVTRFAAETGQQMMGVVGLREDVINRMRAWMQLHSGELVAISYVDARGRLQAGVRNAPDGQQIIRESSESVPEPLYGDALASARGQATLISPRLYRAVLGESARPVFLFTIPVYARSDAPNSSGVLLLEVALDAFINDLVGSELAKLTETADRRVLLLNNQGEYLLDSAASNQEQLYMTVPISASVPAGRTGRLGVDLEQYLSRTPGDIEAVQQGNMVVSALSAEFFPAVDAPWRLVLVDNVGVVLGASQMRAGLVLAAALIGGTVLALGLGVLLRRWLIPFEQARELAQQIVRDGSAADSPTATDNQLVRAMLTLSDQVRTLAEDMENQQQRLRADLEIATRISREASLQADLDGLLSRVIGLICAEYRFQHAQIFLLDDVGANAILAYSHGTIGQTLLRRRVKIPLSGANPVAQAIRARQSWVDLVPEAEQAVLPDIRARLVLPLFAGDTVIGALDIQSSEASAFKRDLVQAFELLANQVGIAVANIRLLRQSEERVSQINALNRELTRAAWESAEDKLDLDESYHYSYDLRDVTREPAAAVTPSLSVPITIRGHVVGSMDVAVEDGVSLTPDEQLVLGAITERVALAVDRARLVQETQFSLNETSLLYELSRRINEASQLDEIIQAIVVSVMPDALGGQLATFDDYMPGSSPEWLTILVDWYRPESQQEQDTLGGLRLRLPDHVFLSGLDSETVTALSDIETDARMDEDLRRILRTLGTRALVAIPLTMRGLWRGVIFVEFPEPRRFSQQELRIFSTLIDQAGVSIDNSLLLRQTEETLDLRERMYAVSRAVNTAQSVEDLVRALLATADHPDLNFALSLLEGPLGEAGWPPIERVVVRSQNGDVHTVDEVYPLTIDPDSPWHERLPLVVHVSDTDPRHKSWVGRLQALGLVSTAVFPLFSINRPFALLHLLSPQVYEMSSEDYEFYVALTGQISTVLQNRRLLEQTEAALEETSRLYAASSAISRAPNLVAVYAAAAEHLADGSPFTRQILFLLAVPERVPDTPYFEYGYVWQRNDESYVPPRARIAREELPYVTLAHGRETALLIRDISQDLKDKPELQQTLWYEEVSSLVVTPLRSRQKWFGLLVCTSNQPNAFDAAFSQFVQTVGDQIALAVENYDLIEVAQAERETLSSILESMPSGVLVFDAQTLLPLQQNRQIANLLGKAVSMVEPFSATQYNLFRTGTQLYYADDELPILLAAQTGRPAFADDIVAIHEDGSQTDLLINAAPLHEADGSISMIVATFENISSLRGLENALQDNLRETIALYEATRELSAADEIDDVLDVIVAQLMIVEPFEAAVVLLDETTRQRRVARAMMTPAEHLTLPDAVFGDRDLLWIDNCASSPLLSETERENLLSLGIQALGTMPLRTRQHDQPLAWMVVAYDVPRRCSPEDERFLSTLADSAAVTLDNRYLFQRTQSALQEASTLYRSSRAVFASAEPKDILQAVVDHLLPADADHAFLALLNGPSWELAETTATVVSSWTRDEQGVDLKGISLSAEQFPGWRLLAAPNLLIVDNVNTDPQLNPIEQMGIQSLGAESLVILPLRAANRPVGAIWIGIPQPHQFTDRDLRVFQAFAEQTAIALEAARLYEQAERRAGQLQTSAQVSQFASSILDLDVLLPRLVELIRSAFQYDHVQVFLMDREDRYALLRASTGEAGRQLLAIGHKLEKGSASVIGTVTAENRPVVALDTGLADVIHRPNPYLPLTRSEMALPLVIKNKVVGALDVQSNRPNAFTEEDVAVLTTLAAQISVAIDNARLFEQAERRASDMSLLFAVTTAAASAESLEDALGNVVNDLRDSLNALSVGIFLPVEYLDEITGATMTTMRAAAVAGYSGSLVAIPEIRVGDPTSAIGLAAQSARSRIINQIAEDSLYQPIVPTAQSAVVVPLTSAAQIVGLITMENSQPFAYNHETLTLLQTMGGTLTALIQNQQLLEQLQKTNEQLLEIDRLKSEFLANMSHELRTPLNSIIGFSRVILKGIDGPLTEMQEQDLSTIYNSGQHLLNLINDILDQAKIAAGKMEIKPDYFDIKAVVDGVRSIGIGLVKDKPIDIKIDIESGLPKVYGDEFRTRQVLLNLLSNAAKFTQQGSITLSVYRTAHSDTGRPMVRVDVTDTGIGIAEKDLPLLFEAFRQVDSSLTRTAGGTGLGLPISKSLIELQGGEMLVQSRVNYGSTFSITIPLEPAKGDTGPLSEMQDTAQDTPTPQPSNGAKRATSESEKHRTTTVPAVMMAKRQILVIEDNADRVDQFRRIIQREGFDVFAASSPLEAEAMASGLRPSVIIMDVNFAGGAGWEIMRKLKERDDTFDIPLVVVTLSGEKERALEAGAFAFLQHPIVPEDLVAAVQAAQRESSIERILIIDDQPDSARLLTQLLGEHGHYRVFTAQNGSEGVSMVARRRPDLVLLDLRMPEMDGFAVLDELRTNPETAHIPVLVITGDTLNSTEENQLGEVSVLYKSDISLEDYQQLIAGVEARLSRNGE